MRDDYTAAVRQRDREAIRESLSCGTWTRGAIVALAEQRLEAARRHLRAVELDEAHQDATLAADAIRMVMVAWRDVCVAD